MNINELNQHVVDGSKPAHKYDDQEILKGIDSDSFIRFLYHAVKSSWGQNQVTDEEWLDFISRVQNYGGQNAVQSVVW